MKKLLLIVSFLLLFVGVANATQANNTSVTKLYVATFDRAPDSAGLSYWVNQSQLSLENIAMSFFEQPETKALYPDGYGEYDFILAIYKNLFKRIPDSAGSDYWQNELSTGTVSKSVFILAVVNGAKDDDATILENKTQVGLKFVASGSNDKVMAKSVMENVTSNHQTVSDSFNKISKMNINGNGNIGVSNGNYTDGNNNTSTGDTTINDNSQHTTNNNNSSTTNITTTNIINNDSREEEPIKIQSSQPTVNNMNISLYEEKSAKIKVTFSVSSDDELVLVRVHCGVESSYDDIQYKDTSISTGSKTLYLNSDKWFGQKVYCKTEVKTENSITTVKEASIDITPQKIAIPNSIFFEESTGLMWQDDSDAKSIEKLWITEANYRLKNYFDTSGDTATTYCNNISLGDYNDWRLPTIDELEELYNKRSNLNNLTSSFYWTSTSAKNDSYRAWVVHFNGGNVDHYNKIFYGFVRCVRAGE